MAGDFLFVWTVKLFELKNLTFYFADYFRWPGGIIPYNLDDGYNNTEINHIMSAMEEFHLKTCIRFVPRKYQVDYLSVIKFRG